MNNTLNVKTKYVLALASIFLISSCFVLGDNRFKVMTTYLQQTEYSLQQLLNHSDQLDATACLDHLKKTLPLAFKIGKIGNSQEQFVSYRNELNEMVAACSSQEFVLDSQKIVPLSTESLPYIRAALQSWKSILQSWKSITVTDKQQSYDKLAATTEYVNKAIASHQITLGVSSSTSTGKNPYTSNSDTSNFASQAIIIATPYSTQDRTNTELFGEFAVNPDLSNLAQQKAKAKEVLYSRGYIHNYRKPLFVYSGEFTQHNGIDQLTEIAETILSLGGQLIVICSSTGDFPESITQLVTMEKENFAKGRYGLKVYTDSTRLSRTFRDTEVSNQAMILFAADFMLTSHSSAPIQNTDGNQQQFFQTIEAAMMHWESLKTK